MTHCLDRKKRITGFYGFIGILFLLKLVLMGMFSSDYQNEMFMPFVNGFLDQLLTGHPVNPYDFFAQETNLFPYPPMMLLIESTGGLLSRAAGDVLFLRNMLFKLPSLFFDCLGLIILLRMFPEKEKYISILYFASPIVLYAVHMHGQLDMIPTTLLLGALYYLTDTERRSGVRYILLLSAAIACKLHILAVVPLLCMYLAKRDGWKRAIFWTAAPLALAGLCVAPFFCQGFVSNVLFNQEQSILTKIVFDYINVQLYLPILAVLLIYLWVFTIPKINRDLLFSCCGILFSVFLLLIPPMPGWYVWVVPFIAIFFITMRANRHFDLAVYLFLNGVYLLYFTFAHRTDYTDLYFFDQSLTFLKQGSGLLQNSLFTVLVALLLCMSVMMYRSGVASNSLYRRQNLPFTIGIAGDSGSGKSTFLGIIRAAVGEKRLLTIEGDGDHKWERGNAMWEHFTHLNPKSNYLYRQAQDIAVLRAGQSVYRSDYDHDTGKFTKQARIRPKPYIVLCGLHSLYLPQVRNMLDLKIYMDIDENLRRYWKIQRDTASRGYDKEKILNQIERRLPDAEHYIYPQKKYADMVITYFDPLLTDCYTDGYTEHLHCKVTMDASVNLEPLIQAVEELGVYVQYDYDEDLMRQTVVFEGTVLYQPDFPVAAVAQKIVPNLEEIASFPLVPQDGLHGILELILLLLISQKMREGNVHV